MPIKIVIIPIYKNEEEAKKVLEVAKTIGRTGSLDENILLDQRDYETPGSKFNEWEKKGIPLRIELGPKDLENNTVTIAEETP